jgi:hypothetical protein
MTLGDVRQSLSESAIRLRDSHSLARLWWDAKGDWMRAHEPAQLKSGN